MPCAEVLVRNIKFILRDRNIRIRELAAKAGISESYLSSVLNGNRNNISDEFKDRLALSLGVPVWRLFTEPSEELELGLMSVHDSYPSQRRDLRGTVDVFLELLNLEDYRGAFHEATGMLDDDQSRSVLHFLAEVIMGASARGNCLEQIDITSLNEEEMRVLACFSIAGDGARMDWVRAICEADDDRFDRIVEKFEALGIVGLVEDCCTTRSRVNKSMQPPLTSMFTQARLRELYLALAMAMQNLSDTGSSFEARLGEKFLKAGLIRESAARLEAAASSARNEGLWDHAAQYWYRAGMLHGSLGEHARKVACLIDSAVCYCQHGRLTLAEEIAVSAVDIAGEIGIRASLGRKVMEFASCVEPHDLHKACTWYRKALKMVPRDDRAYGAILMNLASRALEIGQVEEANAALTELDDWLIAQDHADEYVRHMDCHRLLVASWMRYESRDWDKAEDYFRQALLDSGEDAIDSAVALHNIGETLLMQDRVEEAIGHLEQAIDAYQASRLGFLKGAAEVGLARAMLRRNCIDRASTLVAEAFGLFGQEPSRAKGWAYLVRASLKKASGQLRSSIADARKAIDTFKSVNAIGHLCCASLWLSKAIGQVDPSSSIYYENLAFGTYRKKGWDVKDLHRDCSKIDPTVCSD